MKKVLYKGLEYEAVIIDGSIVLQSLTQDVTFEGAYLTIVDNLKKEWWSNGALGSQRAYVLEYETESILEWIKDHEGTVQIHELN